MHPDIAEYAGSRAYDDNMRCADSTKACLDVARPGLSAALTPILATSGAPPETLDEKPLRIQYFVVKGERRKNPNTGSCVVVEHCVFFLEHIWPLLHEYFQDQMQDNVRIQVAYKETKYQSFRL